MIQNLYSVVKGNYGELSKASTIATGCDVRKYRVAHARDARCNKKGHVMMLQENQAHCAERRNVLVSGANTLRNRS